MLVPDVEARAAIGHVARDYVMANHTYEHRMAELLGRAVAASRCFQLNQLPSVRQAVRAEFVQPDILLRAVPQEILPREKEGAGMTTLEAHQILDSWPQERRDRVFPGDFVVNPPDAAPGNLWTPVAVAAGAKWVGILGGGAMAVAVRSAASFEQGMARVKALAGATGG